MFIRLFLLICSCDFTIDNTFLFCFLLIGEMAGKSNKSKAKRAAQSSAANSTEAAVQADAPAVTVPVPAPATASALDNGTVDAADTAVPEANQIPPPVPKADDGESQVANNDSQPKQGYLLWVF